ncbi:MAG: SprB repeat-containing protein [Lewinellaceae bacterium]|nr:SprB repeat-containing protein [Lewinellaceae bacterium]
MEISIPFCIQGTPPSTSSLTASITPLQEISCQESQDGVLAVSVTGGNGNYQYRWSTGAQTPEISNLSAGNYTVTVSDGLQQQKASYDLKAPLH